MKQMTYVIRLQVVEAETGHVMLELDSVKTAPNGGDAISIAQKAYALVRRETEKAK